MEAPVQAILFIGIIPALLLLFIALKGYEGYYKEKSIFLTFVIGIILGVIAAIIRLILNPPPLIIANGVIFSSFTIVYIFIFAFFEQLLKTIILNIGRLQLKKETTIYGLSLGLGFGSAFTPFLIIAGSMSEQSSLTFLSLIAFGSIGFILFHSASGAYIGYGIFRGKMTKYLFITIILQLPFNIIADLTRSIYPYYIVFQFFIVIFGAVFFIYVLRKVMPQILKKK
jgi:hypothetical protein